MELATQPYLEQVMRWPREGRHILAQYDESSIVVYQAYRPSIGYFAAQHGFFGGEFSLNRMSWIKTNFLWMMYRCGWASKPGQEVVLAVHLKRSAFDAILADAVHSSYVEEVYGSYQAWRQALEESAVRLQWDPDHHPSGAKVERRAIQLGLRDEFLEGYANAWIDRLEDITPFVRKQASFVAERNYKQLMMPREMVYPVSEPSVHTKLGLDLFNEG